MRTIAVAAALTLGALALPPAQAQPTTQRRDDTETVTVHLSNFAFAPEHLRLKAGVPVRLRLLNESGGGHDFSAPEFFATAASPLPVDGGVAVGGHQTVEISIVPRTPGVYRIECTHFLHSIFGMHGSVEVTP